jgi:hypothetical protein
MELFVWAETPVTDIKTKQIQFKNLILVTVAI